MQLQQSTAASLRANWLGIINVDVLTMADSEDKLGGPLLYIINHSLCMFFKISNGRFQDRLRAHQ